MPRKMFVIYHSLRNFIVSSVLSSIVIIINTTTDGIVVSQAVSTDAISVVSLVTPVLTIVQLFGSMLFSGAALVVASWMGMDMKGAALASLIAPVVAMVVYVPYLSTPPKPFTFDIFDHRDYVRLLDKSLVRGMPSAVGSLIMAFLYMAQNYIVLHTEGADGMYILSVCIQTVNFGLILTFAANSAVRCIGGMMYGERDWDGLNHLLMSILKIVLAACIVVTILVYIYPTVVADIYGADDRLRQLSEKPIRLFVQSLVPLSILMLVSNIYMMPGRGKLSSVIQFGPLVIMLPMVWLISTVMPDYFWYSIPLGLWILLLITDGCIYVLLRRGEKLHWLFLTPTKTLYEAYTVSICFDEDDAKGKLQLLQDHIASLDLNKDTAMNVWHCLKELTRHELDMGKETGQSGAFDVSLQNLQERLTVIIKDVGKAYNPPVSHQYCNNVNYQYLNGQNCLYLNFPKRSAFASSAP